MVDGAVFAFVYRHHHHDQHVVLHAVDQAVALFAEFDFVVAGQGAVQLGAAADDYQRRPISAVAWAPTLGRPKELIAVAAGPRVVLWALAGAADALAAQRVAVLDHSHDVWQLGWNLAGNWLAASTEGGEVCMWRPDLAGEWLLLNTIKGSAAEQQQGDGKQA